MTNFNFFFWLFLFPAFLFGKDSWASKTPSTSVEPLPFLNADFFADSLSEAYTMEEDPMGEQRLLQVRNSTITPSVTASSYFIHTNNPLKQPENNKNLDDITNLMLSLNLSLGVGEFGIGENVVVTPNLTFVRQRVFVDPVKDQGSAFLKDEKQNTDSTSFGLSIPFLLPNDFRLTFAHSYSSVSTYRGSKQTIMYSNTPSLDFSKDFLLINGDVLTFGSTLNYTFSKGPTGEELLKEQFPELTDEEIAFFSNYYSFNTQGSPTQSSPSNSGDNLGHVLYFSYSKQLTETLIISSTVSHVVSNYTKADNKSKTDKILNVGLNATYQVNESLSLTASSSFTRKRTSGTESDHLQHFDDLTQSLNLSFVHSF